LVTSTSALPTAGEWRLAARARLRDTTASAAVRFASLDTAVAVVDSAGLVRAVAPGTTTVVTHAAADPSVRRPVAVTVTRGSALIASLFAEPSVSILTVGDTVRLRPFVGLAPTAPPNVSRDVVYTVIDTAFVTVTPSGLVRGRKPGTARILIVPVVSPALRFTAFVAVREPPL
jgi:hypothetical protein